MPANQHDHAGRTRFDTLFADPRHYRGDLRLMRAAIRRGWLDDAPLADRDALVARFEQATRERAAAGCVSGWQAVRVALAQARVAIELVRADQTPRREVRYARAGVRCRRREGFGYVGGEQ